MRRPLKVLVSAYACEPDKGSEPYVGWSWIHAIAKKAAEVHVLTRSNNRHSIERAIERCPVRNLRFHYFDGPLWVCAIKKRMFVGEQLYYCWWQRAIERLVEDLHAREGFDAVHHLTFGGMLCPPGVRRVSAPLIWGPVGLVSPPSALGDRLHPAARANELLHSVLRFRVQRGGGVSSALRDAAVVILVPTDTKRGAVAIRTAGKIVEAGNIFLEPGRPPVMRNTAPGFPLRLVSLARLIHLKGLDLGVDALAVLNTRGMEFAWTIIGDGPERKRLQGRVRRLGLERQVLLAGWLPRDRAMAVLKEADLLLHPAYREVVGGAVVEGMAHGLPVVCLDWGGPSFLVGQDSGIKVPAEGTREDIVCGLAAAIEALADSPEKRRTMGEAAHRRVAEHFSLEALDRVVEEVYGYITG